MWLPLACLVVACLGGVATWIIRDQLVDLRAVLAAGLKACLVEAWQEAEAMVVQWGAVIARPSYIV